MVVIGTNDGHDFGSCKQVAETRPSPDLELHILDGVYHAFDEPTFRAVRHDVGGRPMLYNAGAVETSRKLVLEVLQKHK